MESLLDFGIVVAIVIGIVQALKVAGVNKRYLPISSVCIGILAAFVAGIHGALPANELVIQGIIAGLSACGLWSGTKTVVKG